MKEITVTRAPGAMEAAEKAKTAEECADLVLNMTLLIQEMTGEIADLRAAIEILKSKKLRLELAQPQQVGLAFDDEGL